MTRRMHPTPWAVGAIAGEPAPTFQAMLPCVHVRDADGIAYSVPAHIAERIVRAVNAYESATAKAERAVVRAALLWSLNDTDADNIDCLQVAIERLLAARAKAKKRGAK